MSATPRAPLIVVAGPSGVGKTTVVNDVLARAKFPLRRAITATSRAPRPGERVNEDYHFWTAEQFQKAIAAGDMLEHAVVHGRDFYGTPLAEVEPHRQAGIGILLVIDVQGAASVRQKYPHDHVSVFVMAPSDQDIEARLRSRGSEDEAKIQRRLQTAREDVGRANEFDHQLVNADRTEATETLEAIIRDQFYLRGF